MDLNPIVFSNIISFILFSLAGFFLVLRWRDARLSVNVLIPLFLSIFIYAFIAFSNILEHSGVTDYLDSSENIAEIVFLFICILFINNWNFQISLKESEKQNFRQEVALKLTKLVYWEYDVATDLFTFNDRVYALFGTSASEQGGNQMSSAEYAAQFTPPGEADVVAQEIEHAIEANDPDFIRYFEHRMIRADGQKRYLGVSFGIVKDKAGRTVKIYGASQDITEKKRATLALQLSEERYRKITKCVPDLIWTMDLSGRFTYANAAVERTHGLTVEEFLQLSMRDVLTPRQFAKNERLIETELKKAADPDYDRDTVLVFESEELRKDGSSFWAEVSGTFLWGNDGKPVGIIGTTRDISERKKAELRLNESEKKYRSLYNNVPVGIFRTKLSGDVVDINAFLYQLLNILRDTDKTLLNSERFYKDPEDKKILTEKIIEKGKVSGFECQLIGLDNHVKWVSISARGIKDDQGNIQYIDGVVEDITEKRAYEKQLKRFATIIEQANEEVVIADPNGFIQYVNPSFEINTGYQAEEVIGRTPAVLKSGLHDRAFYKDLWQTVLAKKTWKGVIKNKCKNGAILLHDTVITPIIDHNNNISAFVSIRRDITKQAQMEEQILQSQKMQAIGTLAGGIAHDFNNILSGIFGYSQIAKSNIEKNPEKAKDCISNAVKAAQRATELVQQILTFSRQTEFEMKPYRIYPVINEALKLLRSSIPVTIDIKQKLESRSMILADPTRIHQIVMNLCTNAYHSMRKTGGILTVCLGDKNIVEPKQTIGRTMPLGRYLYIKVSDTGHGMDKRTLERAFEPYFSTKKQGEGTGLGLAIVQAIIDEHDGFLEVTSVPGEGTSFYLYFPIVEKQIELKDEKVEISGFHGGNETVMVVDDEDDIRQTYKEILDGHGYQTVAFNDVEKALDAFKSNPGKFDILITDLTMPVKSGAELTEVIRSIDKDIPIILCTGFSEQINERKASQIGVNRYLNKPLLAEDLLRNVHELLNEKQDK